MVYKLILLGLAGAAGTLARYGLAGQVHRSVGNGFPWGTLAVNIAGCFLAGAFYAATQDRVAISPETRTIILIGFMGAFTTFSAFALDTGTLLTAAQWAPALGNIALQNGVGIAGLLLGLAVGRLV